MSTITTPSKKQLRKAARAVKSQAPSKDQTTKKKTHLEEERLRQEKERRQLEALPSISKVPSLSECQAFLDYQSHAVGQHDQGQEEGTWFPEAQSLVGIAHGAQPNPSQDEEEIAYPSVEEEEQGQVSPSHSPQGGATARLDPATRDVEEKELTSRGDPSTLQAFVSGKVTSYQLNLIPTGLTPPGKHLLATGRVWLASSQLKPLILE